jgi:SAM-dependent methyltransferase
MARHVKNHKKKRHGTSFWDSEYTKPEHLALSTEASEDLEKFLRWMERQTGRALLNPLASVVDFGCGNGRNLVHIAREYDVRGIGYDSSSAAIKEAIRLSEGLRLTYSVRTIGGTFPLEDASQAIALDMMSSHFLKSTERTVLRDEIHRTLKPGGFLFMKTFLRDGDLHTKRLTLEAPGDEANSYIHPIIGVQEHVYSEEELVDYLSEKFIVHKTYLSHKHTQNGKAKKRRTVSVYAEKDPYAR